MKVSSKFKIAGTILLILGGILVVLSLTSARTCVNCGQGWEAHKNAFGESYTPNIGLLFFGSILTFVGIGLLITGFRPEITKTAAKLTNETLDHAGKDISDAMEKSVDVVTPAIGKAADAVAPALGKVVSNVKGSNKKSKLDEAKALYENGDISKEEYEAMRKDILGLND